MLVGIPYLERGKQVLKYILVRFGYLPVIGLLLYLYLLPSAAERQLKRTQVALQKATSWRMESQSPSPDHDESILQEVVCPYTFRQVIHVDMHNGAPSTDMETVELPTAYYERTTGKDWKRSEHGRRGGNNCLIHPPLLDSVHDMLMIGKSEKGDKRVVAGESCRDWRWEIPARFGPPQVMTLCINGDDDLPREIRIAGAPDSVTHYSKWNQPITVLEPEMPPPPEPPPLRSYY
jgi:hypothetical protein